MKNILHTVKMMATAFAVAFVVYSCKGKLAETDAVNMAEMPMQTVDDMFIVQSKNGIIQMRAQAPLMEKYEKDSLSYELFPDNAKHVKHDNGEETWSAFGNVVVKNLINQEVMETDTLYWDQKNEKIYTNCYVRMYSPKGFLQGYGMESDQRARNSIIFKPFNSYGIVVQDTTKVLIDSVNFIGPMRKK